MSLVGPENEGIDLENFDLEERPVVEPPREEAAVKEPETVTVVREALDASRQQNAEFLTGLLRQSQPQAAPAAPELPTWDSFDVPPEIATKASEDLTGALRDYGRHLLAHATPVYTQAIQNAAAHGAQMGSQQAIAAIEGQRMAAEHAPTFHRLPDNVKQAIAQDVLRDPAVGAMSALQRWQHVEARTTALASVFGAQPQAAQHGYAGSSVRSDIAPTGARQGGAGPRQDPDSTRSQIDRMLALNRAGG